MCISMLDMEQVCVHDQLHGVCVCVCVYNKECMCINVYKCVRLRIWLFICITVYVIM